jgi:hypothetical protein
MMFVYLLEEGIVETKETKLEACYATVGITVNGDDLPVLLWVGKPTDDVVTAAYMKVFPTETEFLWNWVDVKWGDANVAI